MITGIRRVVVAQEARFVSSRLWPGIARLAEAHDYAGHARTDHWQYALEIDDLKALGLTDSDLHWLVRWGYAECGREVTQPHEPARRFQPAQEGAFGKHACFVATEAGLRLTTIEPNEVRLRRAA